MANRTEPKTPREWIRYVLFAVVAIWLILWLLQGSGIDLLSGGVWAP